MPGTSKPADVATDLNAVGEAIWEGGEMRGYGHRGMVQSARWLINEVSPCLVQLNAEGYDIVIVGHSLGAGVG
eukprot:5169661-Amphidinium_carterae.1